MSRWRPKINQNSYHEKHLKLQASISQLVLSMALAKKQLHLSYTFVITSVNLVKPQDAKDQNAFFKEFLEELMSSRYATTPVKFAAVPCHLLLSSQLAECVQEKKKNKGMDGCAFVDLELPQHTLLIIHLCTFYQFLIREFF